MPALWGVGECLQDASWDLIELVLALIRVRTVKVPYDV
jgi:hypothetical protein